MSSLKTGARCCMPLLIGVLLLAAVSACGGGEGDADDSAKRTEPPSKSGPEKAWDHGGKQSSGETRETTGGGESASEPEPAGDKASGEPAEPQESAVEADQATQKSGSKHKGKSNASPGKQASLDESEGGGGGSGGGAGLSPSQQAAKDANQE